MSNAYPVRTLSDVSTIVDTANNRMVKVRFKENRKTGEKKENKFVEIPQIRIADIESHFDALVPHFISYLETVQDSICRGRIDSLSPVSAIPSEDITMIGVIDYLETEATGGRLTKDAIAQWFDASLSGELSMALCEKMGVNDPDELTDSQASKITATVNAFREKLSSLSGGKTSYPVDICQRLLNALAYVSDTSDVMASRLTKRLEQMIAKPVSEDDLLSAL